MTETLPVIHNGRKVNVDGPAESRLEQQQSDSTPVSCDGSILMLIISFTEKREKKKQAPLFKEATHTTQALARKQRTRWSKQKPHTHNYNLLHLTQLHVSWIIRQRLDNPDRSPFHSLSPPRKFSFCSIVFGQSKAFKDFRFSGSKGILALPRNFTLYFPYPRAKKHQPPPPKKKKHDDRA